MRKLLSLTLAVLMLLSCLSIVSCDSSDSSIDNSHSHSYGAWQTTKAATCESAGEQSRSCSCGDIQTAPIPATAHSWEPATYTDPKTCSTCGATQGVPLERPTEAPTEAPTEPPEPVKIELTKENFEEYFSLDFYINDIEVEEKWVSFMSDYFYSGSARGTVKIYPLKNVTLESVKIRINCEQTGWGNNYRDFTIPYDGKYDGSVSFSAYTNEYVSTSEYWDVSIVSVSGYVIEG